MECRLIPKLKLIFRGLNIITYSPLMIPSKIGQSEAETEAAKSEMRTICLNIVLLALRILRCFLEQRSNYY